MGRAAIWTCTECSKSSLTPQTKIKFQCVSPLFCKKGATHKTNFTWEAKKNLKEPFFIANEEESFLKIPLFFFSWKFDVLMVVHIVQNRGSLIAWKSWSLQAHGLIKFAGKTITYFYSDCDVSSNKAAAHDDVIVRNFFNKCPRLVHLVWIAAHIGHWDTIPKSGCVILWQGIVGI